MEFNIDATVKRVYHIEDIRFDCASNFGAVFTVSYDGKLVNFDVEYVKLFGEFEDNTYSNIKEYKEFKLLDIVNYLIERQNKYILDKIVMALNINNCEVLRLDAYAD